MTQIPANSGQKRVVLSIPKTGPICYFLRVKSEFHPIFEQIFDCFRS